jgi:hypothetical protein
MNEWSSGMQRAEEYQQLIGQETRSYRGKLGQGPLRHGERYSLDDIPAVNAPSRARSRAIRRGKDAIASLIERTKPHLGISEVSDLIGVSDEGVRSLVRQNRLLGFRAPSGDDILFPEWQFESGEPVAGLERALAAFNAADPLEAVLFFASESPRLQGRRPIDALRAGDLAQVIEIAARHAKQGGR